MKIDITGPRCLYYPGEPANDTAPMYRPALAFSAQGFAMPVVAEAKLIKEPKDWRARRWKEIGPGDRKARGATSKDLHLIAPQGDVVLCPTKRSLPYLNDAPLPEPPAWPEGLDLDVAYVNEAVKLAGPGAQLRWDGKGPFVLIGTTPDKPHAVIARVRVERT